MNLDPRSLKLNTEMGMIIDSPELAAQMLERVEANLPQRTYRVELTDAGLQWTTQEKGENVILKSEPKAGFKKRLLWRVCSILPIEGQL
jgi:putative cardiolipin synthase